MRQKQNYPNLPEDFRELCTKARLKKRITMRQMAEALGCYASTISQLEKGDRNFSYERAIQFRDYLELDYDLPKPDLTDRPPIIRHKSRRPVEHNRFKVVIDGEVYEVLTYRKLGSVKQADGSLWRDKGA